MELEGQVALITGGTRGIGRGIAEAFVAEGANVVINGRSADKGAQAIEEMDAGDQVHFIAGDVTDRETCEGLVDQTVEHYGKIDIVVPNAGGGTAEGEEPSPEEQALLGQGGPEIPPGPGGQPAGIAQVLGALGQAGPPQPQGVPSG